MEINIENKFTSGEEFGEAIGFNAARSRIVMEASRRVDRALFIPEDKKDKAYTDEIIDLTENSTISQPTLVIQMIDHLGLTGTGSVLEVGTASGYSAAILSHCADEVHTMEIDDNLARSATERLSSLGYNNIHVHSGDGGYGLPESGPYDGIVVTAAARGIPQKLLDQLAIGGRLVIPIGTDHPSRSRLMVFQKMDKDRTIVKEIEHCFFVPLVSDAPGCWTPEELRKIPSSAALGIRQIAEFMGQTEEELRKTVAEKFGIDPNDDKLVFETFVESIEREREREKMLAEMEEMEVIDTPPNEFTPTIW